MALDWMQDLRGTSMDCLEYWKDLDNHPTTEKYRVSFNAVLATPESKPHLADYFNGSPKATQVKNVTPGKIYEIVQVEGFGDCCDFKFFNDVGDFMELADFFWEG